MDLSDGIKAMIAEQDRKLGEQIRAIPSGYRLCVHELEIEQREGKEPDLLIVNFTQKTHVLLGDALCDARVPRTEYERF